MSISRTGALPGETGEAGHLVFPQEAVDDPIRDTVPPRTISFGGAAPRGAHALIDIPTARVIVSSCRVRDDLVSSNT